MLETSSWVSGLIVGAGFMGAVVAPGDGDIGRDGDEGVVWANAAALNSAIAATAIGMVRIASLQFPYKLTLPTRAVDGGSRFARAGRAVTARRPCGRGARSRARAPASRRSTRETAGSSRSP